MYDDEFELTFDLSDADEASRAPASEQEPVQELRRNRPRKQNRLRKRNRRWRLYRNRQSLRPTGAAC